MPYIAFHNFHTD